MRAARDIPLRRVPYAKGEPVLIWEIDRAFTEWPFPGVRRMRDYLVLIGYGMWRKRVRRPMRLMDIAVVCKKPEAGIPHPDHTRYPYLLRNLSIVRPKQFRDGSCRPPRGAGSSRLCWAQGLEKPYFSRMAAPSGLRTKSRKAWASLGFLLAARMLMG